jgi:hypothetical protein
MHFSEKKWVRLGVNGRKIVKGGNLILFSKSHTPKIEYAEQYNMALVTGTV